LTHIHTLGQASWTAPAIADAAADGDPAADALERGDVLFFPRLPFDIHDDEIALFSPAILTSAKNASFDSASSRIGGTTLGGEDLLRLQRLMRRFSDAAATVADRLLPSYRGQLMRRRASFRPAEIAGRAVSWRKDDTRLHVDSFPATPVQGRRILRVFSNVNPDSRPRRWRVGDDFERVVDRFQAAMTLPWRGQGPLLQLLRVTKTRRTPYDALMLQLHDRMKQDAGFQAGTPQTTVDFPAGATWVALTDQVSHAAMAGQYQLEQTFLLPVSAMREPSRSPLRILEQTFKRRLV
jgi:hypothetical protein